MKGIRKRPEGAKVDKEVLGQAEKGRLVPNRTWKARPAHANSYHSHRFSMEIYSQLLKSEAMGCRKHPTDFRGFLAIALLNNTCFAGSKKNKKQRLLHVLSQ